MKSIFSRWRSCSGATSFLLFLAVLVCSAPGTARAAGDGYVHCYIFMEGTGLPVSGVRALAGGKTSVSDANGHLRFTLPQGRHVMVLGDSPGAPPISVPVVAGEVTEVIVTLGLGGGDPEVLIEAPPLSESSPAEDAAAAGRGRLAGTVVEVGKNVAVPGARVFVRGADFETRTDRSGRFSFEAPAGTYAVSVIHQDYATQTVEGIEVRPDGSLDLKIELTPSSFELDDYNVVALKIEGGVASLLDERKTTSAVTDIIGAEQISKSGDSNAAAALRRVTGLTLVGGKFVYVRGMGERYSSSLLNRSTLPSPEPERRVVPLDLFPVGIIESVAIQKTYSPDLPGEFGGGAVMIRTKGIPEDLVASVSLSMGYNLGSTGEDGLVYEGGELDWLGVDDGTRALPEDVQDASDNDIVIPYDKYTGRGYSPERLEYFGESMNNIYTPEAESVPMDFGFSATIGDRYELWGNPAGFLLSVIYDNSWDYTELEYQNLSLSGGDLVVRHSYDFETTTNTINLGGMLDLGTKLGKNHELQSTTIIIRTTDNMARRYQGYNSDADTRIRVTTLKWVEQMLISEQLQGRHAFPSLYGTELDWSYTYSLAMRNEPDRRETRYDYDDGTETWYLSDRPEGNSRFFSYLTDNNHDASVRVTVPFEVWNGLEAEAEAGGNFVYRDREVDSRRFKFNHVGPRSYADEVLSLEADDIFSDPNIGADGFQFEEITRNTDNYTAQQTLYGGYAMVRLPVTADFDIAAGARYEYSLQEVGTFELFSNEGGNVDAELETEDILPSAVLTWRFPGDMQLRGGFSQTVSRPDFRELSPTCYDDVVGDNQVCGNEELKRGLITNYDLRWEWYPSATELVSLAFFYKEFEDPIEKRLRSGANVVTTYDNALGATNWGVEFEFRKNFGFVSAPLEDLYVAGNMAYIESEVELEKGGVETSTDRPLEGQSPYVINLTLGYDNPDTKTSAAVLYNVFGERIVEVGLTDIPDTYEQPFHQLDLVVSQDLGKGVSLKFKAKNLLGQERVFSQEDEDRRGYKPGQAYSLGISWRY